jgi:beta-lactamase class A
MPRIISYLFAGMAVFVGMAVSAPASEAKPRYHVSYLWHHDVESVRTYRRTIGALLGRSVTENLKIYSKGDLFGLIYRRKGDHAGAVRAAKAHSRLLRRAGLDRAAPVREGRWTSVKFNDRSQKRASAFKNKITAFKTKRTPIKARRAPAARDLEAAVTSYIKKLRRQGRLGPDERTGWSVFDFTTGQKLVTINEDVQFQAASLIKPFIAAAFFHRVNKGTLVYGAKSRNHMRRMIHWSDNRSTNWVLRQAGGPRAVNRLLWKRYPTIFQDTKIVEYIPAGGKTYRNKASVHDYSRFLYALWKQKIPGAAEIRRLMALPGSDRIFTGVDDIPQGTEVFNKTGSTAHLCGDMGIINVKGADGKTYPYTVIGLIEKRRRAGDYTSWIRSRSNIIRNVSNIVYNGIKRRHDLENDL